MTESKKMTDKEIIAHLEQALQASRDLSERRREVLVTWAGMSAVVGLVGYGALVGYAVAKKRFTQEPSES